MAPLVLGACATLSDVQTGICGNGVVEKGEDCDALDRTTSGAACGAPTSPGACRYICDPGRKIACPEGYACGLDRICKAPADPASWTTSLSVPGGETAEVLAADLDGDGVTDAVSVAPGVVGVTYFERARSATQGTQIMVQGAHATVGALVPSALHLAVTPLSLGLGAFMATRERSLVAHAFSAYSLPFADMRAAPFPRYDGDQVSPSVWFYLYTPIALIAFTASGSIGKPITFGGTLVGEPIVARFDEGQPCGQIAFGMNDGATQRGHAVVYLGCDAEGPTDLAAIADVSLPPASPPVSLCEACQPVHLWDVDADGHPDLVLIGSDRRAYVAYGDGEGHFGSSPGLKDGVTSKGIPLPAEAEQALPLRVLDFNHDCALDFVLPERILVSKGSAGASCAGGAVEAPGYWDVTDTGFTHRWTEAVVTDLNRDGEPDVVLSSIAEPGVSVYLGTGTPMLEGFSIVTRSPTRGIAAGDFDGDSIGDIVFAQIGGVDPDTGTPKDMMHVAFGGPGGAPGPASPIGEVGTVVQTLVVLSPFPTADLAADFVVVAQEGTAPPSAYPFPGVSTRQLNASYYLFNTYHPEPPRRAVIGHFTDNPSHDGDVALFARHTPHPETLKTTARLWLLQAGEDASIAPVTDPGDPHIPSDLPGALAGAEDMLLARLPAAGPAAFDAVAIAAPGAGGSTTLAIATSNESGTAFVPPAALSTLDGFDLTDGSEGAAIVGQMITARVVDGARTDLVLVSPKSGLAVVARDAKTGELDVSRPELRLSLDALRADPSCRGAGASGRAGVAAFAPDASGRQRLMVVFPDGAYLVAWDGEKLTARCASLGEGSADVGGNAVAIGDFDGDGIEDVVVGHRAGLTVYYGDSRPPGPVGEGDAGAGGAR